MAYGQKSKKTYAPKDYTMAGVDLSPHMMDLGADYLKVPGRLLWFRAVHPHGGITTELVQLDHERGFAMFKAEVMNADGGVLATGYGSETAKGFAGGYIEKAETIAIGRALSAAGFGTQFAGADYTDHEGKLADAPAGSKINRAPVEPLKKPGPVTDEQRKAIKAEAIRVGWTRSNLADQLVEMYQAKMTSSLTGAEAADLLAHLNDIRNGSADEQLAAEITFDPTFQKAS